MTPRAKHIAAAASLLWFVSCSSHSTKVEMSDMADYRWSETVELCLDNDDTLSLRDLSIVMRYNRSVSADSVVVDIATLTPDSLRLDERFTLYIPSTGEVQPVERIFPYRRGARLRREGTYRFTISSQEEVTGVESVGMIIENAE